MIVNNVTIVNVFFIPCATYSDVQKSHEQHTTVSRQKLILPQRI